MVSPLRQTRTGAPAASGKTRASPAPLVGVVPRGGGAAEEHAVDQVEDLHLDGVVARVDHRGRFALHVVDDAGAVDLGRAVGVEGRGAVGLEGARGRAQVGIGAEGPALGVEVGDAQCVDVGRTT
jgi:hypothetical protein